MRESEVMHQAKTNKNNELLSSSTSNARNDYCADCRYSNADDQKNR
jgi:hypothetical protein